MIEELTGLHDKKGVAIFEGDILSTSNYFGNGTGQVISGPWSFAIKEITYTGEMVWGSPDGEHWQEDETEIIGNIHNNPEMLS